MNVSKPANHNPDRALDDIAAQQRRDAAMALVTDAFGEALLAGIDADAFAHAALQTALMHLVHEFGEERVAALVADLPENIRGGKFSFATQH